MCTVHHLFRRPVVVNSLVARVECKEKEQKNLL